MMASAPHNFPSMGLESIDSLGNDALLPSQFYADQRNRSPEARLMLAVLEDGLRVYQLYYESRSAKGTRLFQEAHMWIFGGYPDYPFSFNNVCAGLGIDPDWLRRGIAGWDRQSRLRHAPRVAERPMRVVAPRVRVRARQ